ncbi:conserved hypothetical protein [Pseudomonas sp. 9AZ]|uniref:hypothetical protein n=1 Tax=Pseudomonas sp. 9AZ TaxID=2653168 RepID=UPI0012F171B1|nr:hypothetical protein [Pseudomonas sp. 9AZ]VXC15562.1 conserved hypothetical protein [Pseudomonas sp. 9AZ]
MEKIESLEDIARILGDGGSFNPDTEFETVEELVDALVDLGNTDKVLVRHDDHLGLKIDLPDEFLNSSLDDIAKPEFESAIEAVIDQANIIIPLSQRKLSEDDIEEIQEDKLLRGEDIDD